jgi:hypothetical protein
MSAMLQSRTGIMRRRFIRRLGIRFITGINAETFFIDMELSLPIICEYRNL